MDFFIDFGVIGSSFLSLMHPITLGWIVIGVVVESSSVLFQDLLQLLQ